MKLDKRSTIWTGQEEVCYIKMERKGEINTWVVGLNKQFWFACSVHSSLGQSLWAVQLLVNLLVSSVWLDRIMTARGLEKCVIVFGSIHCYLDCLVWPLVLEPLQLGQPLLLLFPWASAPPRCSQTLRSSSAEGQKAGMWGIQVCSSVCQPTEPLKYVSVW